MDPPVGYILRTKEPQKSWNLLNKFVFSSDIGVEITKLFCMYSMTGQMS